uniref:KIB1-4 beta-propeller domain-containing protein n=1 Tax=Hordeum vulgare subsp. vulgare TaxID=112509 RepID=A0A8I7BJD1_HORVV
MRYLGCSYGYLILSYTEHCFLTDVYTATKVKPPKLPRNNKLWRFYGIGVLMAPLNSPLLLCSKSSMLEWQVGTDCWSEHHLALGHENIRQIVIFKGDIFVIDYLMRIHAVHFTPQFSVQELEFMWESFFPINPWLVSCADMLLMVDLSVSSFHWHGIYSHTFDVFRVDLAVEPAKFVKLENYALFISLDKRNPTFSCMSPERWGGKSNCIYAAKLLEDPDESWVAVELGQPVQEKTVQYLFYGRAYPCDYSLVSSLWVFPSLIYGFG